MTDKKPQAGEWWEHEGYRVYVVGHSRDGVVITEAIGGFIGCIENEFGWKHLPQCDSFEWQPETFPQCIVPDTGLLFGGMDHYYIRRTSATQYEYVHATRVELSHCHWGSSESKAIELGAWQVVTQLEAESRFGRAKPVESPDDWVTQDRVPAREAIDQRRFLYPCGMIGEWQAVGKYSKGMTHKSLAEGDTVEVRCRRRDMPAIAQEKPKPNYVRLWTHRTSGTVCTATDERYLKYPDIWSELKHDGTGFFLADDGK